MGAVSDLHAFLVNSGENYVAVKERNSEQEYQLAESFAKENADRNLSEKMITEEEILARQMAVEKTAIFFEDTISALNSQEENTLSEIGEEEKEVIRYAEQNGILEQTEENRFVVREDVSEKDIQVIATKFAEEYAEENGTQEYLHERAEEIHNILDEYSPVAPENDEESEQKQETFDRV